MEKLACLTCEIFIGVNTFLISDLPVKDWFVITDSNVYLIYEELLRSWNLPVFVLSAGEEFKTRKSKGLIEDFLLENGCKKNSGLIAFGGGVICDIVGFVASTYMRDRKSVV